MPSSFEKSFERNFERNAGLCALANESRLHIITVGFGRTAPDWAGNTDSARGFSEIGIVTDGSATVEAFGERLAIGAGKAFLIPAGADTKYYNTDRAHPVEKIFLFFKISALDGVDILTGFPKVAVIDFSEEECRRAVSLFREGRSATDALRFSGMIYDVVNAAIGQVGFSPEPREYSAPVQAMLRRIREEGKASLSVAEVAAGVGLSPSRATALFHSEVGFLLRHFIRRNSLLSSQKDLLRGEMTIGKISEKYGFCDQFHYSRAFKDEFKTTPSEFRARFFSGNREKKPRKPKKNKG